MIFVYTVITLTTLFTSLFFTQIPFKYWKSLTSRWNNHNMVKIDTQRDNIIENTIFRFMAKGTAHQCLNFMYFLAKHHIYTNKQLNDNSVDFYKFLPVLNYGIKRELMILKNKRTKQIL